MSLTTKAISNVAFFKSQVQKASCDVTWYVLDICICILFYFKDCLFKCQGRNFQRFFFSTGPHLIEQLYHVGKVYEVWRK